MPHRYDPLPALKQGSHLRAIAPASPFPREDYDRGIARLRERYRVTEGASIFARDGYLAGSDRARLADLRAALEDPGVEAIIAARGGYGATRLLDDLRADEVRSAKKLLIGFSDMTALHALWARAGLRSIHGPMIAALGRAEPALVDRWIARVEGEIPRDVCDLIEIAPGRAEGPLLGGNLAVLAALAGTPYAPPLEGAVVFLEDVGEAPYRMDRMLTTLRQAGSFAKIAGVALGAFRGCDPREDGRTAIDVLRDRLGDLGVPVVFGIPAGHVDDNLELPFGAAVRLDAASGTLTFLETAVV